jgi:hypothetical protein
VKEISHTYQSTTVKLWLPQLVSVNGDLEFQSTLTVDVTRTDGQWNLDRLRDARMWCGKDWCRSSANPVFADWVKTRQAIELAEKELVLIGPQLAQQKDEIERLQKYIVDNSCESAVQMPPRPTWACTQTAQAEVAKQLCYAKELGAKGCEKVSKDKIPGDMPSLVRDAIAREGCAALMAEATGFDFKVGVKTLKKYTDELPLTLFIEGLKQLWKPLGDTVDWIVTAAKAEACIPAGINHCRGIHMRYEQTLMTFTADATNIVKHCSQAILLRDSAAAIHSRLQDSLLQTENLLAEFRSRRAALEVKVDATHFPHLLS